MNIPQEIQQVIDSNLALGHNVKIRHRTRIDGTNCSVGKSPALSIRKIAKGYVFFCHRCGFKGFIGNEKLSPKRVAVLVKLLERSTAEDTPEEEAFTMPLDAIPMAFNPSEEIPSEAHSWIWGGGVSSLIIPEYGFRYSPKLKRVIIPIKSDCGELIGWIGRDPVHRTKACREQFGIPKYIFAKKKGIRERIYYKLLSKDCNKWVIVEDVLSAIRVHRETGYNTIALLNTSVTNQLLINLSNAEVYVWLDSDQLANMMSIVAKAVTFGIKCRYLHTQKDPKEYSNNEIKTILGVKGTNNVLRMSSV